ncbi:acyl CoA:acetate/3-ketoacid CoA transferase [Halomonas sp. G15]|uniref:acyl CoA:acetate/3-ketoacid CoA transferase n=1 Tax=Halomonas sp. G15 TaxID=2903521 RepID=UPI001E291613|nr:acyl CoA:acetate/3-ketoacid CoA transferase [Halomonas sp. G15]MCE0732433.1 acyl CoA:acetate/3-ketoacid CoA transferase [Halomonas sp. G15]
MRNKITSAAEAISIIRNGDSICTSGFVGVGTPDHLLKALEKRFEESSAPRDLTLVYAAGQGDGGDRGLNIIAYEGLLKRVIGGHWGLMPKMVKLAVDEKIEAYNLPIGAIAHLYRDTAAGKPGMLSHVGIGTFVDPRLEGGKLNKRTTEDLVRVMEVDGRDWLYYKSIPLNVALIRATSADPEGNISTERECLDLDALSQAMAVKNSGGIVIVQVERIVKSKSIKPRDVLIPGALVDCVVVAEPENHHQTYGTVYDAAFSGEVSVPIGSYKPTPLDVRKIIARRCAMELRPGAIVNLGIGMPEGIAGIAAEERVDELITLTTEAGVIGGIPLSGMDFGAALNVDAIIAQNQQFDFYDGGGLDLAFLGMAETDAKGNVNVSRFGDKIAGTGGFINITQNARRVVYSGTFSTGKLGFETGDGTLRLTNDDGTCKFRDSVSQVTFSGEVAQKTGQPVIYVTERCVLELTDEGLELIEVAPGIDVERDILAKMPFRPIVRDVQEMDARIFRDKPMSLRELLLELPLPDRIVHDPARNILFLNFEGLKIANESDLDELRAAVETKCDRIGHRVDVIVSYDSFELAPELEADFARTTAELERTHYARVSRYTTSAFMRLKLGQVLTREVQPHLFETRREAQAFHEAVSE